MTFLLRIIHSRSVNDVDCEPLKDVVLMEILGSAFNPRYMKLEEPKMDDVSVVGIGNGGSSNKRESTISEPSFYVDDDFNAELSDKPAWSVKFPLLPKQAAENTVTREKREIGRGGRTEPWKCESKIELIDLGQDYFPRYLMSVKCTNSKCWYGRYSCKPKSFTVKILKRRRGMCQSPDADLVKLGITTKQLREVWVWEERAVNFCCDCVQNTSIFY